MKPLLHLTFVLSILLTVACNTQDNKTENNKETQTIADPNNEMLREAYQLFKEGDDAKSIELANKVLAVGRETNNDTLIGRALTSLCRNAQRKLDTTRLAELSAELEKLAASSGNQKWLMYRAHMNAEMYRLIGNMDKADRFYNESLRISEAIGADGMYMIDHFNKSFVSTAKGDFQSANDLIKKYYQLRRETDSTSEDAYGLIALAYLLEQQKNYNGAHEVATVCRRLFKEQNIFPEPPDEKPLLAVEQKVKEELPQTTRDKINEGAGSMSVSALLDKYLK